MRHFLGLPGTITMLARGVGAAATGAGLIAPPGFAPGAATSRLRAAASTIALAAVTVATDEYRCAAAGAEVASSRRFHRQ